MLTDIFSYHFRNSSRTPVYSMSYNPAENCVLLCTVSEFYMHAYITMPISKSAFGFVVKPKPK